MNSSWCHVFETQSGPVKPGRFTSPRHIRRVRSIIYDYGIRYHNYTPRPPHAHASTAGILAQVVGVPQASVDPEGFVHDEAYIALDPVDGTTNFACGGSDWGVRMLSDVTVVFGL